MKESIHKLMEKEHKRIVGFIEKLEKEISDYEKTTDNFHKLKWNLQKHFFVEEKAIFETFVDISGKRQRICLIFCRTIPK